MRFWSSPFSTLCDYLLAPLQWLAVCSAHVRHAVGTAFYRSFYWLSLLIGLGYPAVLSCDVPALQPFSIENLLLSPTAICLCTHFGAVEYPFAYGPGAVHRTGLAGVISMLLQFGVSRVPTSGVLGLVGNIETLPVLALVVWQGERVSGAE